MKLLTCVNKKGLHRKGDAVLFSFVNHSIHTNGYSSDPDDVHLYLTEHSLDF